MGGVQKQVSHRQDPGTPSGSLVAPAAWRRILAPKAPPRSHQRSPRNITQVASNQQESGGQGSRGSPSRWSRDLARRRCMFCIHCSTRILTQAQLHLIDPSSRIGNCLGPSVCEVGHGIHGCLGIFAGPDGVCDEAFVPWYTTGTPPTRKLPNKLSNELLRRRAEGSVLNYGKRFIP